MVNTNQYSDSTIHHFTSKELLSRIRLVAATIGSNELGFSPNQLALHSAWSGAAMAMYLGRVHVFTIMLLCRWSSEAFLWYIHKQVQEFSKRVSQRMIANENFLTISSQNPSIVPPANCSFANNIGLNFKDMVHPLTNVFRHFAPRHSDSDTTSNCNK
jgi:hypothetical protein